MTVLTPTVKILLGAVGGFMFARIAWRLEPYMDSKRIIRETEETKI